MDYRISIRSHGGPDVLEREAFEPLPPARGEVRIRQEAVGLNFIDTYHRSGLYPLDLPTGLGTEAAGVVDAVGDEVMGLRPGDRVAYAGAAPGSYATRRNIGADFVVPVPPSITSETAAAVLLKGMTAEVLVERCARMAAGQTALVHAAAGGVGSILVQWLKAIGVRVLAHAGSEAKAGLARAAGADAACAAPFSELSSWVRAETGGAGVNVVFDGVGAASWDASLRSVAPRGLVVSYGNASGPVPPFAVLDLMKAGSIFVTRPTLWHYCATPDERRASAARLFAMMDEGAVRVNIGLRLPLAEVAEAHRRLEARETTGAGVLLP